MSKKKDKDLVDYIWVALSPMPEQWGGGDAPKSREDIRACHKIEVQVERQEEARAVLRFQIARELLPVLIAQRFSTSEVVIAYAMADELIKQGEVEI